MYDVELVTVPAQPAAVVSGQVEHTGIAAFLSEAFGQVQAVLSAQHVSPAGPPFARYRLSGNGFDIEAGFPVHASVTPTERVAAMELPGGPAAQTVHRGDYAGLRGAYEALEAWLADNGYVAAGGPWESYLDEPDAEQPRTLVTYPCTSAVS